MLKGDVVLKALVSGLGVAALLLGGCRFKPCPISKPTELANGDGIKVGRASLLFRSFGRLGTTQSEVQE